MKTDHRTVERRKESFVQRQVTRIWQELPSADNPFTASEARCHGYELLELMERRSFADVLYLLFQGELPDREQAELLEALMIGLISPGPRHPATRAAMCAGVGKTDPAHILPISLSILGGSHLGAGEIEDAMRFLRKNCRQDPRQTARDLSTSMEETVNDDHRPAPGFGSRFGGMDEIPVRMARYLSSLPGARQALTWGCAFSDALAEQGMGWLATGVAAATLSDLGFQPRAGAGLYQLFSAPGLLAHGVELASKPFTAMPFPADEDYVIEQG